MSQKYRSKLEQLVAKKLPNAEYESYTVDYWQKKRYTPDFVLNNTFIEVKGFFRPGDQAKYIAVKEQLEEYKIEFVFLFSHPNKPVRKGAKLTMAGWAEKNNIKWFSLETTKDLIRYAK